MVELGCADDGTIRKDWSEELKRLAWGVLEHWLGRIVLYTMLL